MKSLRARPRVFAVLPTLLTLGNLVCGFGSITYAAKVGPEMAAGTDYLFVAAMLIFLAMLFDLLDGSVARWTKQTSGFGAQLDSLCDVISFGVAPAFIMLKFSYHYHPRLLWVIAVLFTICAVLRLARFNVETDEDAGSHETFRGLPSPAAAGTVASFAIAMPGLRKLMDESMPVLTQDTGQWLIQATSMSLPIITLVVACLMVSRIRYPHLFHQWFRGRRNFQDLVQIIFAIIAVFAVHELAVPLIFLYFVLGPPLRAAWMELAGRRAVRPSTPVS